METKTLLSGLIGFFIGGLLVSTVATLSNQAQTDANTEMTMSQMTDSLKNKTGDDYDKAFTKHMIAHHEGAVAMAKLSATNAKHEEIKLLSKEIIENQSGETDQMKHWMATWKYATDSTNSHDMH